MTARNLADTPQAVARRLAFAFAFVTGSDPRSVAGSLAVDAGVVGCDRVECRLAQRSRCATEATTADASRRVDPRAGREAACQARRRPLASTRRSTATRRSSPAIVERGKLVFTKRCATCHRLQEIGKHVGPGLDGADGQIAGRDARCHSRSESRRRRQVSQLRRADHRRTPIHGHDHQ